MKTVAVLMLAGMNRVLGSNSPHYEKPPCQDGEELFQITGTKGYVCAPACHKGTCPADVPEGVSAKPQCALSDPLSNKYCVLECGSDKECDQKGGATCDLVQPPKGVCVYKKKLGGNMREPIWATYDIGSKSGALEYESIEKWQGEATVATNKFNYGNPSTGCKSDEVGGSLPGLANYQACYPKCLESNNCPTDLPDGTTAKPGTGTAYGLCLIDGPTPKYDKHCLLLCKGVFGEGTCPAPTVCVANPGYEFSVCQYPTNTSVLV